MAAQPRKRRPAARRRPACLLAAVGPRGGDGLLQARRVRRGRRRRRDSRGAPARLTRRAPGVRSMTMPGGSPSHLRGQLCRFALAGMLGVAIPLLASCGSSGAGLIPVGNAGPLQSDFEAVAQAAENGDGVCATTESAILKTEQDFSALPSSVDAGLRNRLHEGISKLRSDALSLCKQPLAPATATSTTSKTTTTTSTPPTAPPPTVSSPTTSQSTPTNTTAPPNEGGGTPAPGGEATPGSGQEHA